MARTIHLNLARADGELIQGANAANPVPLLRAVQDDKLQLVVHDFARSEALPAVPAFVERELVFTGIRASIGLVDAAPKRGTFKLRVGAETTAALTWPADLSTDVLVAAWKSQVLAALEALPGIGAGGIRADDFPGTPAHIFYFTWADIERDDEIEVVENRLLPPIDPESRGSLTPAGYTQQVKLAQFPLATTSVFTRPFPPALTRIETVPGAPGANAEQTIVVPASSMGSVAFVWMGASTRTMAVATLAASQIASALNELVPDGATNPSFRVEARPGPHGKRFAVEFIGPLAASAQPLLGINMLDQIAWPWAIGYLDLEGSLGIEQALNGAPATELVFELVIDDDETFLKPLRIANNMTTSATAAHADEQGLIDVREQIIYVDSGLGESFVEASPGASFTPPTAGATMLINHGLNTWRPKITVTIHEVDHTIFAADPTDLDAARTGSYQLDDDLYVQHANSSNVVQIDPPWELVDDPTDPHDYRLISVDIYSPDTKLLVFPHKHDFDGVLESIPGGQTLRAKLAAIEASIGLLGGDLNIQPASLDLPALIAAIVALLRTDPSLRELFLTLLRTVITDEEIIRQIATELRDSQEFIETLISVLENAELITKLFEELSRNLTFEELLRRLVLETLQGGTGTLPPGTTLFAIPSFEFIFPPPQTIPAPSVRTDKLIDVEVTTDKGSEVTAGQTTDKTGEITVRRTKESAAAYLERSATRYDLLSPSIFAAPDGGNVSGTLATTATAGQIYTATAEVRARTESTRRGTTWPAATKLTRQNGHWYEVRVSGANLWPREMESEFFRLDVSEEMFFLGSRLAATWLVQAALEGNAIGTIDMVVERGVTAASGSVATPVWTEVARQRLPLTPAVGFHQFALSVERKTVDEVEAFLGAFRKYGQSAAFTIPSANVAFRGRFENFDCEDLWAAGREARGCLKLKVASPAASIAPL